MLTQVVAVNNQGSSLALPLGGVHAGYIIQSIDGLDPVKALLSSSRQANLPGERFEASALGTRNIVLNLGIEPDYVSTSVAGLREQLYDYFMSGENVTLTFVGTKRSVMISGVVESFTTPLFSAESSVAISVLCFEPDFLGIDTITNYMTYRANSQKFEVTYEGSRPSGLIFDIETVTPLTSFSITSRFAGRTETFSYEGLLQTRDRILVNTNPGEKSIRVNRPGSSASLLNGVPPSSDWPKLYKGDNSLLFTFSASAKVTFTYKPRYGGL